MNEEKQKLKNEIMWNIASLIQEISSEYLTLAEYRIKQLGKQLTDLTIIKKDETKTKPRKN